MDERDTDPVVSNPELSPTRRGYEAPAIVESAHFETLALACGQTPTTGTTLCDNFPSNS